MSYLIEGAAVPLADVAKHTKTSVAQLKADCERLGVGPLGHDWRGLPAVTPREAHELTTGRLAETVEHERAWHDYSEAAEQWARARDEAFRAASAAAGERVVGVGPMGRPEPRAESLLEAGRAAARAFEEANPAPSWTDGSKPLAQERYLEAGLFRRALDRLGVA